MPVEADRLPRLGLKQERGPAYIAEEVFIVKLPQRTSVASKNPPSGFGPGIVSPIVAITPTGTTIRIGFHNRRIDRHPVQPRLRRRENRCRRYRSGLIWQFAMSHDCRAYWRSRRSVGGLAAWCECETCKQKKWDS